MGMPMAGHLLKAGHTLYVYNRSMDKSAPLLDMGATALASPAEVAAHSDVVITMIGFPSDVEQVYLGEQGLIAHAKPGTTLIDMTTSSPALAKRIYEAGASRGIHTLDAPVSGGDVGAKNAALSIMVGGDAVVYERMVPLFQLLGNRIELQGGPGAGQHTKMCNQIAIASGLLGVCEAILYAEKSGLDPSHVLKSIESGAAGSWSLSNLAPRMIAGNFAPGFYIKHFIKDMTIALESAEQMGIITPGLALVLDMFKELADAGDANSGTHALYKFLQQQSEALKTIPN